MYNIMTYGAAGDGFTNDGPALQRAINACSEAGGGRILIPGGKTFVAGPFHLKSNIELYLEQNAVIMASLDESLYTESAFKENKSEGSIWICGRDVHNVVLDGNGIIDGRGTEFMLNEEGTHFNYKFENNVDRRPHLLTLIGCRNITIRNVTFRNAAHWCIHPVGCQDILIHGIRILNNLKVRNSDGIDPDHSRNIRIHDCYIESADDCICLKCRREYDEYGPTENVIVTGCTLVSTSCAIKLGSENTTGIRNAVFSKIIITGTNRAVGIQNRDEGIIENIIFSDFITECRLFADVWWGKAEPIYVTAFKRHPDQKVRFKTEQSHLKVGHIRNIQFRDFICQSENGIYVSGCDDTRPENITFDNINIMINKTTEYPGRMYDRRPCNGEGILDADTSGFHLAKADNIVIRNSCLTWGKNIPDYYGYAIYSEDVTSLSLDNFTGKSADPDRIEAIVRKD